VAKASNAKQIQLLRTAQQRMAAMLATSSSGDDGSMRTSNAGPPGSSTTEESSSSSIATSALSVSELKAETRKCQAQLRDVQSEMQRLREAKTEAVRTGYAPSDRLVCQRSHGSSGAQAVLARA
jgi:hypothetical protein